MPVFFCTQLKTVQRIYFITVLVWINFWQLSAQSTGLTDSLVMLPTIEVKQNRLQAFQVGANIQSVDSSQMQVHLMQNLTSVLSNESAIYLKNYGPGRLATTSIRGAGASQTALVWNGIPLLQPMLGQFDFSLFPTFFIDELAIQPGGGSTMWGNGAIGGSIHLNSPNRFKQKWQIAWQSLTGSFQHFNQGLKVHYSNQKWSSTTRAFYETAEHNFSFENQNGNRQKLPHAQVRQKGLLQETAYRINAQQQVGFRIWWQDTQRNIPPIIGQQLSAAQQKDRALRVTLNWQINTQDAIWKINTAFFDEQLDFLDTLSNIDSKSKAQTALATIEWTRSLANRWQINANVQHRFLQATSTGYANRPQQQQSAIYTSLKWLANSKWTTVLSMRQEFVDSQLVPFVPALEIAGDLGKGFRLKGSLSRNFRLPTFNDLYWTPGGQPDLEPEKGWSEELTLVFQNKNRQWLTDLTLYNRNIDNWIIWLPGSNFWSPENVLEVWSRGLETKIRQSFQRGLIHGHWSIKYHYSLSTNQKAKSINDASVGKQLIYQPQHQAQFQGAINWKKFNFTYSHQYTGKVFILADHSADLPAFQIGDLQLGRSFSTKKWQGKIQFSIRNIWNENYQTVVSRPMPGRYYELQMSINFKP